MTANDLADRLEQFYTGTHITKAAETLRNQFEEINNLKQWQNRQLDVIKSLEAQVYGGTTK